jgi:hypothetical protein
MASGVFSEITDHWSPIRYSSETPDHESRPGDGNSEFGPSRSTEASTDALENAVSAERRKEIGTHADHRPPPAARPIVILELLGMQDKIRQLVFTGAQWQRFCDALPVLRKFLEAPTENVDRSVVTFSLDLTNEDIPGRNPRALEIVYRAILWSHSDETMDDKRLLVHVETPESNEREPWRANPLSRDTPEEVRNANRKEMAHMEEACSWTDFLCAPPWTNKLMDLVAEQEHAFVNYIKKENTNANLDLYYSLIDGIPGASYKAYRDRMAAGDADAQQFIRSLKDWKGEERTRGVGARTILSGFYEHSEEKNVGRLEETFLGFVSGIEKIYPQPLFKTILIVSISRPLMSHGANIAAGLGRVLGAGFRFHWKAPDETNTVYTFQDTDEYRILLSGLRVFRSRLNLYALVKDSIRMVLPYTRVAFSMITLPAQVPFPSRTVNPSSRSEFGSLVDTMLVNVGLPEEDKNLHLEYLNRLRHFMLYTFFLVLHYDELEGQALPFKRQKTFDIR